MKRGLFWITFVSVVAAVSFSSVVAEEKKLQKLTFGNVAVDFPEKLTGYRAKILDFVSDPIEGEVGSYRYFEDGMLLVQNGKVVECGNYDTLSDQYNPSYVKNYQDKLIMPGFIDTHVHMPQLEMIGAYGKQLLDWLQTYTFPAELQYSDKSYAEEKAEFFINELLKNGTTTALVMTTVFKDSTEAFFEKAYAKNLRMIAGNVMMDRNAIDGLHDTPKSSYENSKALIDAWHGKGRLAYAVTPRFAPTSTPEQLAKAGQLMLYESDLYMHTHLSENLDEIAWVKSLFPEREGYLDVYDYYGLTGNRSVFAHSIYLEDSEWLTFKQTNSVISHCPTSNLFLGSGFFNLARARQEGIRVGMGTDVGAGTSLSIVQTLNEAYKVQQMQKVSLSSFEAFYLATLGGAKALSLDDKIGNFNIGNEADFVVLDTQATALLKLRMEKSPTLKAKLFVLMTIGDDRIVKATYSYGNKVYDKGGPLISLF
ncbi:MAG: guanine deaminase [Desulfobacteraceae bacterium]|nr:guanine deaminase [Desulfobacteraceae bacterium]